jgi:hypothetical protein
MRIADLGVTANKQPALGGIDTVSGERIDFDFLNLDIMLRTPNQTNSTYKLTICKENSKR